MEKYYATQLHKVYDTFFSSPKTMKEADVATGVMRENICWYCRALRQQTRLFPIRKRYCKVTRHLAIEWTTNPDLIPKQDIQLNLWD